MNDELVVYRFVVIDEQHGEIKYDENHNTLNKCLNYSVREFMHDYYEHIDTDWREPDSSLRVDVYERDSENLIGSMNVTLFYTEDFSIWEIESD